jgi:hypothetical protein
MIRGREENKSKEKSENKEEIERKEEEEIQMGVVYVDQRVSPSLRCARLCQALRSGTFPYLILGNSKFIESLFLPYTIPIYIPPTFSPPMRYQSTTVEDDIEKIRNTIRIFWEKHGAQILERYRNLEANDCLINSDQDSWPPLLSISEALDNHLGQDIFKNRLLDLAKRIINNRIRGESSIPLEMRVLEAIHIFLDGNPEPDYEDKGKRFYGPGMLAFIRELLTLPKLQPETVSRILNDHEAVVGDPRRPHLKDNITGKKFQPNCYALNHARIKESLNRYINFQPRGEKYGS